MQRFHQLSWLALAIGLLATQCLDSISDDCTQTLTCPDEDRPTLQPNCVWKYRDGTPWPGGPLFDTTTRKWRWPDGTETDTQDFRCDLTDAGADAGLTGPDCRRGITCDLPLVCDFSSGNCVECLTDAECSGNVAVGDAGAAVVCDDVSHQCVPCLRKEDCTSTGSTLICKVNPDNSRRNACVQCEKDDDCSRATPNTPVCDETSNECTTACTSTADCGGDKPVCNTTKNVCVECLGPTDCKGAETQCNVTTNQCVECVDEVPCAAAGEVCDTSRNSCVQCLEDTQCANGTHCDTDSNLCVQCLNDEQCVDPGTSRCNAAEHVCVGCNADSQCESGFCNPMLSGGTCVQCRGDADCESDADHPRCEIMSGACVGCLESAACPNINFAHCQTEPGEGRYSCVACVSNDDCAGKFQDPIRDLCDTARDQCVECTSNAECLADAAQSRCQNGTCARCSSDSDCSLVAGGRKACSDTVGCVECTDNTDCVGNADGPVCKTNTAGQAAGTALVNTCVQCQSNTDCTSPGASVCSDNRCVACTADAAPDADGFDSECAHVVSGATRLRICAAGTCVQCTGPRRAECGTNVCNSLTRGCTTDRAVGSASLCEACVSDAECTSNARCVQQTVAGTPTYFCFPLQSGGLCSTRGFAGQSPPIPTIDTPSASVCLQRETTCPAYLDYISGQNCDDEDDDEACGNGDGACELGPAGFRCTISCISPDDCTGVADCQATGCEL